MGNLLGNEKFSLVYQGVRLMVRELTIQDQQVYRIVFDDGRDALTITRASTAKGRSWTSIPQGRLKEAEAIGKIIEAHLKGG
ncbi:hypothetical protein [Olivibacter jilunii]|uniref:hypothetical protein n=1 Tax=Olivibacter jilunii TaxID=985016 RepID=UPI0010308335|nr:hypothetical protein [Olivibacter jilunii]